MELLNGLIHTISVDFESTNSSTTPVDLDEQIKNDKLDKQIDKDLAQTVVDLLNLFREWKKSIEYIESQCPLYDYKNIKANGFRTIFKLNTIGCKRVNKILSAKELTIKDLIKSIAMAKLMIKINNKIKEFHQKDLEFKQNLINNNESNNNIEDDKNDQLNKSLPSKNLFTSKLAFDFFEFYCELEQELADYFRYHPMFFFRKGLRKSAKSVLTIFGTSSNLPNSLVFSKKKKSKFIAKSLTNPTFTFPFSILGSVDCSFYNDVVIPVKHLGHKLSTSTIYIPRQHKYLLNDIETCVNKNEPISIDYNWSYEMMIKNKQTKSDKIRIRIIKNKTTPKSGTVIFHVHGGAFVFHSPECHEIYTREFAKKLPEVVIVSVSYRKRSEYPKGQQDVLDVYLWLTSGLDEVEEVIGFQPKRILLLGDSAGAFLNFSLTHILIDFNREIQNKNLLDQTLRYPDAIFNYYGFYSLTSISPALFISCLDFFLPPSNIRIAFGSLLHGVEESKLAKRVFFPCFADKKKRWYDTATLKEETSFMVKHFEAIPYLNSVNYFDYDAVKVPLYLVTSDVDICLDHNLDLANRWKGTVQVQLLEDMIHGFLQLEQGDESYKEDILKSINFLRTAVDKL